MDPRQRVRQLQREIKELCVANEDYLKKLRHTPTEINAHHAREQQLNRLLNELMKLGKG